MKCWLIFSRYYRAAWLNQKEQCHWHTISKETCVQNMLTDRAIRTIWSNYFKQLSMRFCILNRLQYKSNIPVLKHCSPTGVYHASRIKKKIMDSYCVYTTWVETIWNCNFITGARNPRVWFLMQPLFSLKLNC